MRIALFCGSLGAASANRAALDVAASYLVERGTDVETASGLDRIPAFRPELVDDAPEAVITLRSLFERSDGVLLAAPEYAGGVAGMVKNATDWMVGAGSLYRKPIGVLSAGTSGGSNAIEQLVRTLTWQGALVLATLGIAAPRTKMDEAGSFTDPATISEIQRWAEQVREAPTLSAAETHSRVAPIVNGYGLDPAHLG